MEKIRIGVIGSGKGVEKLDSKTIESAIETGKLIARKRSVLVCGGLSGVMEKAAQGAKEEGGTTIGILPHSSIREANPYIDIPIATGLGEVRNILVVRNSDVIIAINGGFGTLSEIAFAKKLGRSVIGLDTWELNRGKASKPYIIKVYSPEEAVNKAIKEASKQT